MIRTWDAAAIQIKHGLKELSKHSSKHATVGDDGDDDDGGRGEIILLFIMQATAVGVCGEGAAQTPPTESPNACFFGQYILYNNRNQPRY